MVLDFVPEKSFAWEEGMWFIKKGKKEKQIL